MTPRRYDRPFWSWFVTKVWCPYDRDVWGRRIAGMFWLTLAAAGLWLCLFVT